MNEDKIHFFTEIGFTNLEANIYIILLKESNLTGYKIAQIIDKPVPNTYKALDSLQKKGVIVLDESGKSRLYSALPIADYLDQLERNFKTKRQQVEREIKALNATPVQEGIYRIEKTDQLYERADKMIKSAKEIVIVDVCPTPFEHVNKSLQQIARRNIKVIVKTYTPVQLPGCEVIYSEVLQSPLQSWPLEWMHLVVDGCEHLTALLEKDGQQIFQGIWCKSTFLAMVAHNGLFFEVVCTRLLDMFDKGMARKNIQDMFHQYSRYRTSNLAAVQQFVKSYENMNV